MPGKKYALTILALSFVGLAYTIIYTQIEKHKMSIWPKLYVLDAKNPNQLFLFIRNLKYKKEYFEYVRDDSTGVKSIPINFPSSNVLPTKELIYFRRYLSDSNLIEFYSPTYHNKIWGLRTGYIYRGFVTDSLRKED